MALVNVHLRRRTLGATKSEASLRGGGPERFEIFLGKQSSFGNTPGYMHTATINQPKGSMFFAAVLKVWAANTDGSTQTPLGSA